MSTVNSQIGNDPHQPFRPNNPTTVIINGANETPTLCDITLLCVQRKKRSKRHVYLTFVESHSLSSSSNEQPCIEITGNKTCSTIPLNECISLEYFDTIANDFQSFIYIHFQSYTVSIYFSNEDLPKKSRIVKHLEYMFQKPLELLEQPSECLSTAEHILHTFDVKLTPYESIISRNHVLLGPARLYFTRTDLYIASIDCNRVDLRKTLISQCPLQDQVILCIPYFTIKQYGNRSDIFLIELGKSNYGNGEIHMQCVSSLLASTIHLLVSPVIEERPSIFPSTFQHQSLADKRMAKSKSIQPPIKFSYDTTHQFHPSPKRPSIESLPEKSSRPKDIKTRSVISFLRKKVYNNLPVRRSPTVHTGEYQFNSQPNSSPQSSNKFFELNIETKRCPSPAHCIIADSSSSAHESNSTTSRRLSLNIQEIANGTYIDMVPTVKESKEYRQEETDEIKEEAKETAATIDTGVNTTISLPPYVRSAIIVGDTVHLIAEESPIYPIGQRSFTSPASVMQPFKAQLYQQTTSNAPPTPTGMITRAGNSSSSFHQPISTSNSQQSLLLSYGIVTFNNNLSSNHQLDRSSTPLSDESILDRRLNSDFSVMSFSHQQQPANIYAFDGILSSSSSSRILRRYSLSTGDSTSGPIPTPNNSILFFDEMVSEQPKNYLLEPPSTSSILLSDMSRLPSLSRSCLSTANDEKLPVNDPYVLIEPSSSESVSSILFKPLSSVDKSVHYTDVLFFLNTGDEPEDIGATDDNVDLEEKTDRATTLIYTDIDYHQTQRRDRLVQSLFLPKNANQTAPFIL